MLREFRTWWRPIRRRLAKQLGLGRHSPASLIRRSAWDAVGGLDPNLHMAMDYDLWWRLVGKFGAPQFVEEFVAANRDFRYLSLAPNAVIMRDL